MKPKTVKCRIKLASEAFEKYRGYTQVCPHWKVICNDMKVIKQDMIEDVFIAFVESPSCSSFDFEDIKLLTGMALSLWAVFPKLEPE